MSKNFVRRVALAVALMGAASLGGCYVAPYPGPYYYGHPHYWGWR
jgi:hypothetical protein